MFKKILSVAVMATALFFSSCEKENINVDPPGTGSNANDGFNWSGTAPFSVFIDGVSFDVDTNTVEYDAYQDRIVIDADGKNSMTDHRIALMMPADATNDKVYSITSTAFINYDDENPEEVILAPISGKLKVVQNTSELIEGYFYCTVKNYQTGQLKTMTKGYFKVNKK